MLNNNALDQGRKVTFLCQTPNVKDNHNLTKLGTFGCFPDIVAESLAILSNFGQAHFSGLGH
jgi:hypothetical protein